jgi:hypothetical protein
MACKRTILNNSCDDPITRAYRWRWRGARDATIRREREPGAPQRSQREGQGRAAGRGQGVPLDTNGAPQEPAALWLAEEPSRTVEKPRRQFVAAKDPASFNLTKRRRKSRRRSGHKNDSARIQLNSEYWPRNRSPSALRIRKVSLRRRWCSERSCIMWHRWQRALRLRGRLLVGL